MTSRLPRLPLPVTPEDAAERRRRIEVIAELVRRRRYCIDAVAVAEAFLREELERR